MVNDDDDDDDDDEYAEARLACEGRHPDKYILHL